MEGKPSGMLFLSLLSLFLALHLSFELLHFRIIQDRYYRDKCKADDVSAHGGREHMYR
jgi:hypothetical protein